MTSPRLPSGATTKHAAFFRFRQIGERVLLTGIDGGWILLESDEFEAFTRGELEEGSSLFERLRAKNFLRDHVDVPAAAASIRRRKRFIHSGPNLHVLVLTLRCNETCAYCHASRANMDAVQTDMTAEVAEKTVDFLLQTTNPYVTIEFQGGEPLVNWEVLKHVVHYALDKSRRLGKELEFTMVSNLALMTEEKLSWLLEHRVQICTSIDGPQDIHDKQRKLAGGSSHEVASGWIRRINEKYSELNLDPTLYHVEALVTTTRPLLSRWKDLVDTYVDLGCRALFLRPLDPFGWASRTAHLFEYPRSEYLEFYRSAVDYMIELNLQGVEILERYAAIFLTKILSGEDPNFLDIRSPSGAGIGQLAYNYDGRIFTCDEGRMLHHSGDDTFALGNVSTSSYREVVGHETVRAVVIASQLEGQPDCVNCVYVPYCGIPPVHSYKTQGTLFGRMRESTLCQVHKGIQDYLFEKLGDSDAETLAVLERWTTNRSRDHFLHPAETNPSSS
ncbi:MAG: His-Xaa-Ser system radical SAM maturase HxsB [Myxococcota bacterium]